MPAQELWEVIVDPHHLPRWWPRVGRVEDVEEGAFTEVMATRKGKLVRADFDLVACDERERVVRWRQRVDGTPFERVLQSAETEVRLAPLAADSQTRQDGEERTDVTIELNQVLRGMSTRFGAFMVRRAAAATIEEALDGLERISG